MYEMRLTVHLETIELIAQKFAHAFLETWVVFFASFLTPFDWYSVAHR